MKIGTPAPVRFDTWDQVEQSHVAEGQKLTFREKLQWLEEAAKMVEHLARGARREPHPWFRKK